MKQHKSSPNFRIDRLVNFSDAVIAIAVTLMILPLVDRVSDLDITSFSDLLDSSGQQFLIFFISFAVICKFWIAHHTIFSNVKAFDSTLFWLNSLWLLAIVIMPFTTELIGKAGVNSSFIIGLYIGVIALTAWVGTAMEYKIAHSPQLQNNPVNTNFSFVLNATTAIIITVAMVVSIIFPAVGAWSLFLLFLTGPINRLFTKTV